MKVGDDFCLVLLGIDVLISFGGSHPKVCMEYLEAALRPSLPLKEVQIVSHIIF